MSRTGIKELASSLTDKHGLNKTDAERFVTAIFEVINDGLKQDKLVKVKGLGSFKIVGIAARKSVDVNTGEPIVIEGRDKISFTPDAALRDEVNKPFSQFETVAVNDGVDFVAIDKEFEEELSASPEQDSEASPATVIPSVPSDHDQMPDEEPEEDEERTEKDDVLPDKDHEEPEEDNQTPENDNRMPEGNEEEPSEETSISEPVSDIPIVETTEETAGDDTTEKVEEHQNHALKALIVTTVVIVIGCFCGGYYLYKQIQKRDSHIERLEKQMTMVAQHHKRSQQAIAEKALPVKLTSADTVKVRQDHPEGKTTATAQQTAVQTLSADKNNTDLQSEYNKDARVRTGAYIITGIKQTVTARPGQTIGSISKAHLGPGMECYVEAVNGGKKNIKAGDKIKIPNLKLKKRLH